MKEMGGKVPILSQSTKDFPPGLGSFSHSFSTKIILSSMKVIKAFILEFDNYVQKDYLANICQDVVLCFQFSKLYLYPGHYHLTEVTNACVIG